MRRVFAGLLTLALMAASQAFAADAVKEGINYAVLNPVQRTSVGPGKVEVMEVFSYGCPACNGFQPVMEQLKKTLPKNAQMVYLPAAFSAAEDWPMLQRAYFTAQFLKVADKTHQAIFDAIWKTGELQTFDPVTHQIKKPLPSIEDAAKYYEHLTGIKAAQFLATAKSFAVDAKMKSADAKIMEMQVPSTPCIVVNGKYRVNMDTIRSPDEFVSVVDFLVAKESGAKPAT